MNIRRPSLQCVSFDRRIVLLVAIILLATGPAFGQVPTPIASNAALMTAITQHGGSAIQSVLRVRLQGQAAAANATTPIVISADLGGSIRLDYGNPVTRSIINTPAGSSVILNGTTQGKPPHVGVFAQLDLLSVFGLLRLQTGNVMWSDLGPAAVAGRSAVSRRADTGQTRVWYRRTIHDQADIRFDAATGLVSSITRMHYGEKSLDLAMPVTFVFSDHRSVNSLVLPFRIEEYLNTNLVEVITLTNIELNPTLAANAFQR